MKDGHSGVLALVAIAADLLAADNTPPTIDLKGHESAEIVLAIGIGGITFSGSNKIEFKLTESDDDSAYNDVVDADLLGVTGVTTGIIKSLVAAHAAAAVYRFGYIGGKRYLKLLADFSGTHGTGTAIAAAVMVGRSHDQPNANQA